MDDAFIEKIEKVNKAFEDDPDPLYGTSNADKKFAITSALATQKWVQRLKKEGISEPFEEWDVEFIIERLKNYDVPGK